MKKKMKKKKNTKKKNAKKKKKKKNKTKKKKKKNKNKTKTKTNKTKKTKKKKKTSIESACASRRLLPLLRQPGGYPPGRAEAPQDSHRRIVHAPGAAPRTVAVRRAVQLPIRHRRRSRVLGVRRG